MKAYELLATPETWCQRTYAQDAAGRDVLPEAGAACRWCLIGALDRCYPDRMAREEAADRLYEAIRREHGWTDGAVNWNDAPGRTWDDVVTLLRTENV